MNNKVLIGTISVAVIILIGVLAYSLTRPAANTTTPTQTTPSSPSTTDQSQSQSPAPADTTPVATDTITYSDEGFKPAAITVKKGMTVTVVNKATTNLVFSSADHPTHQLEPELNMSALKPNETGTFTVTKVGTWGFHDHLSANHTGKLIVTEQ